MPARRPKPLLPTVTALRVDQIEFFDENIFSFIVRQCQNKIFLGAQRLINLDIPVLVGSLKSSNVELA